MKRSVVGILLLAVVFSAVLFGCDRSDPAETVPSDLVNDTQSAALSTDAGTGRESVFATDSASATQTQTETSDTQTESQTTAEESETLGGAGRDDTTIHVPDDAGTRDDTTDAKRTDDPAPYNGPEFTLSKNGKNVVVLFIDRALGEVFPYLVNEKPELKTIYDGFTYYSNVISYGGHTNFGAPPIMGGYEYTPVEMNRRSGERLVDKHNESMKVMPALFSSHGYNVTVCDAPYGNYKWVTDLSVYNDLPGVRTFRTTGYFSTGNSYGGASADFRNAYDALINLPTMTKVSDDASDNFLLFYNDTPHQVIRFREPEYTPLTYADNSAYDAAHTDRFTVDGRTLKVTTEIRKTHYQTNMGTMLRIGEWLDYLRRNGVYDNTKIIIVSDHGYYLHQLSELDYPDHRLPNGEYVYIGNYFPLLMVKDFGAHGFTTSGIFMTNADVPTLAFEGTIEDPVNPYTGKKITSDEKTAHDQFIITDHAGWSTGSNNGSTFQACPWAAVTSDIWNRNDWQFIDSYTVLKEHKMP